MKIEVASDNELRVVEGSKRLNEQKERERGKEGGIQNFNLSWCFMKCKLPVRGTATHTRRNRDELCQFGSLSQKAIVVVNIALFAGRRNAVVAIANQLIQVKVLSSMKNPPLI